MRGLRGEAPSAPEALPAPTPAAPANKWKNPFAVRPGVFAGLAALCATAIGIGTAVLPWRAIAPIARPDPSVFSAATIARGQQLAALGDCVVCHTGAGGAINAGGRALETPFGIIYSTNITPDVETGIGNWSYPAFERAMREGIHRDGKHLYPAFPYTHFAKTTDADLQALYAYLMAQHRCARRRRATSSPSRSTSGRCWPAGTRCSTQRKPSGPTRPNRRSGIAAPISSRVSAIAARATRRATSSARRWRTRYLAGGFAEGWEAPALTSLSRAPIPWSEAELYAYLRTGQSRFHGVAAGPMAPVVKELKALPDQDIRAMAVYLASFNEARSDKAAQDALAARLESATLSVTAASSRRPPLSGRLRRLP